MVLPQGDGALMEVSGFSADKDVMLSIVKEQAKHLRGIYTSPLVTEIPGTLRSVVPDAHQYGASNKMCY